LPERPLIEDVIFNGVEGIPKAALRDSIETQATHCRGLLLQPLCLISSSPYFVEKHHLDRDELTADELRIRVIYFRAGFREAQVSSVVTPHGDGVNVTFNITEGPATRVGDLSFVQTDSVLPQRMLRRALAPRAGDLLDLNRIDSAQIRLRGMLWDRGYGDAIVDDSMRIDAAAHTAALRFHIDPVHLTTIDSLRIEGNEGVSDTTIVRLLGLRRGQLYKRTDMTAAQRRVYESEIFRQTLVQVEETSDSAKTVVVTVREAGFTAVRFGLGFNTTQYGQGEARLTRYNFLGGARRLDVRGAVGNLAAKQFYGKSFFGSGVPDGITNDVDPAFLNPTWEVGATLTEPFVFDARASAGLGFSTHRRSIPGIVIDKGFAGNASLTWRFADRVPGSIGYTYERTDIDAGDLYFCINFGVCELRTMGALQAPHSLSPISVSGHAERADDALAPTRGYSARLDLEHASTFTGSDWRYNRAQAEANYYMPRRRSVLAFHVRAGWVNPLESTRGAVGLGEDSESTTGILHPRKRFYAGGARSVRGFAENQLGPRVLTIDPVRLLERDDDTDPADLCTIATIRDGTCDPNVARSNEFIPRPLGGNTLLEGSVEYRFPLTAKITGAVFVDAGLVRGQRLNLPPGNRGAITPGFGVRYGSPIGPVRVDLGIRPGLAEEAPVVTQYVDDNGELQIVQLQTPLRYDPLKDSKGFLSQITSRLQLHLAIGEAW
jgi:outer membrane protein insertion porin family/translocation and assembly module TamA